MATKNKSPSLVNAKSQNQNPSVLSYYTIEDKILPANCDINLIFGQRSQGKTYSCLKYCLEKFRDKQWTFTYVRRWDTDVKAKDMDRLCSKLPVEEIFGDGHYIIYWRGAFTLCRDEPDKNGNPKRIRIAQIGWAIALNAVHHTKSQSFPDCHTVVFDEFVPLRNERTLYKETEAWEQTLSTILRTNDECKIFLLGNTVSQRSPYFMLYGLPVRDLKQGEVTIVNLKTDDGVVHRIAAEWCEYAKDIGTKTSRYVVGSKMAKTGEWEIPDVADIPHTEGETSKERLVCTIFDSDMELTLGIFLRSTSYNTFESICGIYKAITKRREFLVIRETDKKSSYYHLTTEKDLSYRTYMSWGKMFYDIKEQTGIDIQNELEHGRIYASGAFTADYFVGSYNLYNRIKMADKL